MIKTKGPDLLLINPGSNKRVYEKLAENYAARETPFVAALTAGFARDKGFSVELIDANAENLTIQETAERAVEYKPGLIHIVVSGHQPSASSQLMGVVGDLCTELKGRADTAIFLRGVHPSALPERTLREEDCNFVAMGEGYQTLLGLLNKAELTKIPGLAWIDEDNTFRLNRAAPIIKSLDTELSSVAWDLLPMDRYRSHEWQAFDDLDRRQPYASLYTSLGCPFQCTFCCINTEFKQAIAGSTEKGGVADTSELGLLKVLENTKPTIRYWSPDTAIKHLTHLAEKYNARHIKFIDEMFVLSKKHVEGIADGLIERNLGLNIWAYARVDTTKDERLLAKLKKAGINWLCLGIESANPDVRDGADKGFGNEAIISSVRRVENAGIHVLGNYMVGLRNDTHETMRQTLDLAKELNTAWFNIYATMAYPGTADYAWARERGIPLPGDPDVPGGWTAYSHHSWYSQPLPTETLSAVEILRFRDNAFYEYFTNLRYLASLREKFGKKPVEYLTILTKHRIKRRLFGDPKPD